MPNLNAPTKSRIDFKESLTRFALSTPTRKSSRLLSKISLTDDLKLDGKKELKRTIISVDTSTDEEETPSKKAKVKAKKPTVKRGYASPEKYAHLSALTDVLAPGLDIIFCGINPGLVSATKGHHFANPTNHFWRALHRGGLTSRLLLPSEDALLPRLYSLGLTNLVYRASAEQAELSKAEMKQSVPALIDKVTRYKPRVLCFVGKGIWLIVEAVLKERLKQHGKTSRFAPNDALLIKSEIKLKNETKDEVGLEDEVKLEVKLEPEDEIKEEKNSEDEVGSEDEVKFEVKLEPEDETKEVKNIKDDILDPSPSTKKTKIGAFNWCLQPYKFVFDKDPETFTKQETLIFVMPSTSGRVVSHQLVDKVELFKKLHNTVKTIKQDQLDTSDMIPINAGPASS